MDTFSSHARWLGAIFAAGAALSFDSSARAQQLECTSDADCSGDLVCRFESYQRCSGEFSCTPEGMCTQEGPCETIEYSWCGYPTCITDADCAEGKGCLEQFSTTCRAEVVDGVLRPVCTREQGDSLCTPRYEMPCEVASDCGEGFNCVESFGSACGPTGPNGEFECVPISNHVSYCEVIVVPCATHADCPGVLECQLQYVDPPCTGGMDEPLECPPPVEEYRCATPPFGGGTGGVGGGTGGVGGMDGAGTGSEEPPPDAGEGGASGMSIGGMGGTGGAGGAGGAGAGTGGVGSPDDDGEADEHRSHHRRRGLIKRLLRGCTTTTFPNEGGATGWLMLGAAALLLTRRSRRS